MECQHSWTGNQSRTNCNKRYHMTGVTRLSCLISFYFLLLHVILGNTFINILYVCMLILIFCNLIVVCKNICGAQSSRNIRSIAAAAGSCLENTLPQPWSTMLPCGLPSCFFTVYARGKHGENTYP